MGASSPMILLICMHLSMVGLLIPPKSILNKISFFFEKLNLANDQKFICLIFIIDFICLLISLIINHLNEISYSHVMNKNFYQ